MDEAPSVGELLNVTYANTEKVTRLFAGYNSVFRVVMVYSATNLRSHCSAYTTPKNELEFAYSEIYP